MKPIIGVTRCSHLTDYIASVEQAGGQPRILEVSDSPKQVLKEVDGLLLTGGGDVDPAFYGEDRHPAVDDAEPGRDEFEIDLARRAVEADVPMLAICRGAQVLNVAMGGSLVQDLPTQVTTELPHSIVDPRDHVAHEVQVAPDSRLRGLLGPAVAAEGTCRVNSRHHQAVARLGRGLEPAAVAPDGVVEAIEKRDATFCVGVQWHPENFWRTGEFKSLFDAFVATARTRPGSRRAGYSGTDRTRED
ncbi:MAG TPA: gamma-glutamyl-gamma-aminobutyrate hydrolase family protein [Vicinamibacterales bacterium]|nr:gamma-glutamyl-gamma-aminobutyrate hydrolase family protein [Vicinamibacterales bacterium]